MPKKDTQRGKRIVDRRFKVPAGSESNFVTREQPLGPGEQFFNVPVPIRSAGGGSSTPLPDFYLAAPSVFYIIDQKLRRGPGGFQVVDVVVQVEDVVGALEYEFEIAKDPSP